MASLPQVWHRSAPLDEWTRSAQIGALDPPRRKPCIEGAEEPAVTSHHCCWIATDAQSVVAGDQKPFTRERLEDFLVRERITGADRADAVDRVFVLAQASISS